MESKVIILARIKGYDVGMLSFTMMNEKRILNVYCINIHSDMKDRGVKNEIIRVFATFVKKIGFSPNRHQMMQKDAFLKQDQLYFTVIDKINEKNGNCKIQINDIV